MHRVALRALPAPVLVGLSAALALGQNAPEADTAGAWLSLPDGPVAKAWASVGEATPAWSGALACDTDEGPWSRWARALELTAEDARRREAVGALFDFALEDARPDDAYLWLAEFRAGDPEALAGRAARLFPGVPAGTALDPGGRPARLESGTLILPRIPPPPGKDASRLAPREIEAHGLTVGDATVDIKMKVDGSGVVLDVLHVAGGEAELRVRIPAPAGWRLRSMYLDWEQQPLPDGADERTFDWATVTLTIPIVPAEHDPTAAIQEVPYSVFARVARTEMPLPNAAHREGRSPVGPGGLALVVPEDHTGEPWAEIAAAWGRATALDVTLERVPSGWRGPAPASRPLGATAVRFTGGVDAGALRRRMTSSIEAGRRTAGVN